jgi:multidrug efflux pump subunit AcrB
VTEPATSSPGVPHNFVSRIVDIFLRSNLPIILIVLAVGLGVMAILATPREEDPQIVVPMADVYVNFPGHSAREVEQLVATPLEKLLYQIDGVEYVYSMSRDDQAIITVRYYVGEDRERSLVKLFKKIDENVDLVPAGVSGWVIKPVEIDDVPIVTLALTARHTSAGGPDAYALRRVAEELVERLAAVRDTSRAYIVGGLPRTVSIYVNPDQMKAYSLSPLEVERALVAANVSVTAGEFSQGDRVYRVQTGKVFTSPREVEDLVVATSGDRPVWLKDVARVVDGPAEPVDYVRHGWGPAAGEEERAGVPGSTVGKNLAVGEQPAAPAAGSSTAGSYAAVTMAIAKKKGSNAVTVADEVLAAAAKLQAEVVPDNMQLVVTRNTGLASNDKVNDLLEALAVALVLVIAVLTLGLGWRESIIVAVAVPVVFGLTLSVNLLAGLTINRVTLFALILSLGLLVDDPIVDVENIARHFGLRRKASRGIVLEAVNEIRPPLIAATLAVIVSFLPLFFITGMMGPYMRPMALNVPVTMVMSMLVAFTITPWLTYHLMKRRYASGTGKQVASGTPAASESPADHHASAEACNTRPHRLLRFLMTPLLGSRWRAWAFLVVMGGLMAVAVSLAETRRVPLKMLPYGNKDQLQLVLDLDEGTTLERTDAATREFERYLATVPEVTDFTSYVGTASPMDFNGMVRHYYLRRGDNVADIAVNLADRKFRPQQTHAVGLRIRDDLQKIAAANGVNLKIVESPPGPPVLATVVAEVYGRPEDSYADLLAAAKTVRKRMELEPGLADVDDTAEAPWTQLTFVVDKEKAALSGVTTADIAATLRLALGGDEAGAVHVEGERQPLRIILRLPRATRSSPEELARMGVKGLAGNLTTMAELGRWEQSHVAQTIYHKNLQPVVYVEGETTGRTPAEVVLDINADRIAEPNVAQPPSAVPDARGRASHTAVGSGWVDDAQPRPLKDRTFLSRGGGIAWEVPPGIRVNFASEGEWNMTIDVFRDMGLAFVAALAAIYIILVAQLRSFLMPLVVMLAIPLTFIGIMPGFWLLNKLGAGPVGGYANPVFFTATAMIGMIALAGIVTRSSIIIVDFIHLALAQGRTVREAIIDSCVVRLRPILLTAATAMLSALPITTDPIFSGLAWALIFGLLASTVFTLFVVPLVYWLIYGRRPVAPARDDD